MLALVATGIAVVSLLMSGIALWISFHNLHAHIGVSRIKREGGDFFLEIRNSGPGAATIQNVQAWNGTDCSLVNFKCAKDPGVFPFDLGSGAMAIYLETTHSKGIASTQLAKHIGVKQQTAWFMLQRIRNAVSQSGSSGLLGGNVEIDETYIGGRERNKHANKRTQGTQGRSTKTKAVAFGMKERGGSVRAFAVPSTKGRDIAPLMIQHVALGSQVHADDHRAYGALDGFYAVDRVNHSAGEYVRGQAHTNSIESVWAMTKRVYVGTHHWWSRKHTQLYLNTICYRLNRQHSGHLNTVDDLLNRGLTPDARLTYRKLIA